MTFPGVFPFSIILREVPLFSSADPVIFDEGAVTYEFAGFFDPREASTAQLETGNYPEGRYFVLEWDGTFDEAGAAIELDTVTYPPQLNFVNVVATGSVAWTATAE